MSIKSTVACLRPSHLTNVRPNPKTNSFTGHISLPSTAFVPAFREARVRCCGYIRQRGKGESPRGPTEAELLPCLTRVVCVEDIKE